MAKRVGIAFLAGEGGIVGGRLGELEIDALLLDATGADDADRDLRAAVEAVDAVDKRGSERVVGRDRHREQPALTARLERMEHGERRNVVAVAADVGVEDHRHRGRCVEDRRGRAERRRNKKRPGQAAASESCHPKGSPGKDYPPSLHAVCRRPTPPAAKAPAQATASIRSSATTAHFAVSSSTRITFTASPASRCSRLQQRWARSIRYIVAHMQTTGERKRISCSG